MYLAKTKIAIVLTAVAVTALPLVLGACGSDAESEEVKQAVHTDFDAANFPDKPKIDNEFNPNPPGTQYVFEGRSDRGQGRLPHRVIFTVTDLVKEVNGVNTVVMWDQDINAGTLLEAELAFHAQDNDGNVWNLGEFPAEFDEEGKFEGAPDAWLAGRATAQAGVLMRADPQVGTGRSMYCRWPPSLPTRDGPSNWGSTAFTSLRPFTTHWQSPC